MPSKTDQQFARIFSPIALPIVGLLLAAGIATAETPKLRMWLKQGSYIDGQLQPATHAGYIGINSPQFTQPIEFDVRGVRSIAGDYSPDDPKSGHAFLLDGGTRISGALKAWDETALVVDSPSLGSLTLQRSQLRAVEAIQDSGKRVYSGPKSIDDWKILDKTDKWRFAAGALTSPDNEAKAAGDVSLPDKFRLSLSMSWEGRADFVMSLGCKEPKQAPPPADPRVRRRAVVQTQDMAAVRLEMWDAQLAVVREVGNLADIAVLPLEDGTSKFELMFYVDQVAGLVAVYSPRGKKLEEIRVAEEKGTSNPFVLLENHGKSVSLNRFDVYQWDGHLPDSTEFPDGYVLNKKDEVVPGNVDGFDPDSQSLIVVDDDGKESKLALDQLRRIILVDAKPAEKKNVAEKKNAEKKNAAKEAAKKKGSEEQERDRTDESEKNSKQDVDAEENEEGIDSKEGANELEDDADASNDSESADETPETVVGPEFVAIELDELRLIEIDFADTSRLVGYIDDSRDGVFQFKGNGILGSFSSAADQIVSVSGSALRFAPKDAADASAGVEGSLRSEHVKLSGRLVDTKKPIDGQVLRWHPWSARSAAPLSLDFGGEIVYTTKKQNQVAAKAPVQQPRRGGIGNLLGDIFGGGGGDGAVKKADSDKEKSMPRYEIVFRSGDTVKGSVISVDQRGVKFESDETETAFVPHDEMDSITLSRAIKPPQFDEIELKRLLTVPRSKKDDPPTHLFVSTTGDYLRGRMVGINADVVSVEVRMEVQEIPRANIARVIWLHERPWLSEKKEGEAEDDKAAKEEPVAPKEDDNSAPFLVHAVHASQRGVTFSPEKMVDETLSGESELLGECSVKISTLQSLLFGRNVGEQALALRKESWKLSLAALPKAYLDTPDGEGAASIAKSSPLVGKKAPEIKLQTIDDVEFVLSENRDKVIVLDFWASWCGPCIATMPEVDKIVQEFDPRDVELVAVNLQDSVERARLALKRMEIEPTVVMDVDGETARFYDAKAIPQTVIVDTNGKITHLFVGGGSKFLDQFSAALKEVVASTDTGSAGEQK